MKLKKKSLVGWKFMDKDLHFDKYGELFVPEIHKTKKRLKFLDRITTAYVSAHKVRITIQEIK